MSDFRCSRWKMRALVDAFVRRRRAVVEGFGVVVDDDDGLSSASDAGREPRERGWISGSDAWTAPVWLDFILNSVSVFGGVVGVGNGVRRRERRGWVG